MRRCLPFLIIICILLSGCGLSDGVYANYRAIEELQLVQTLGFDRVGAELRLCAATGATQREAPATLCRSAGSISDAMEAMQDFAPRGELFFAHAQSIVLGEEFAAAGIGELLDFVERDVQMRLGTELYVLRGGRAEALLTGVDGDITEALSSVRRALEKRGDSHVFTARETAMRLSECGAALVCALRTAETADSVFPRSEGCAAVPDGYAIFSGDRLCAYLEGGRAEAAGLLLGQRGSVYRSVPDGSGGTVTLSYDGSAAVQPQWNPDGTPAPLLVEVTLRARLAETDAAHAVMSDAAAPEAMCDALRRAVGAEVSAVLAQSAAMGADFLALGPILRRSSGRRFAALPADWLRELEFDVRVEAELLHSYDLNDPVQTEGGAA